MEKFKEAILDIAVCKECCIRHNGNTFADDQTIWNGPKVTCPDKLRPSQPYAFADKEPPEWCPYDMLHLCSTNSKPMRDIYE